MVYILWDYCNLLLMPRKEMLLFDDTVSHQRKKMDPLVLFISEESCLDLTVQIHCFLLSMWFFTQSLRSFFKATLVVWVFASQGSSRSKMLSVFSSNKTKILTLCLDWCPVLSFGPAIDETPTHVSATQDWQDPNKLWQQQQTWH